MKNCEGVGVDGRRRENGWGTNSFRCIPKTNTVKWLTANCLTGKA